MKFWRGLTITRLQYPPVVPYTIYVHIRTIPYCHISNRFSLSFGCELAWIFAFVDCRGAGWGGWAKEEEAEEDGRRRDQFVNLTGHRLPVGDLEQRNNVVPRQCEAIKSINLFIYVFMTFSRADYIFAGSD